MQKNNIAIDYLRAFVTLLVLAHHSFTAYLAFAPAEISVFAHKPYSWQIFPVVDPRRWMGFDVFVVLNDTFFMSLMFLLAGLFVWPSIARKGHTGYLRGRLVRLGIPFVVMLVFLSPLSYFPSYLIRGGEPSFGAYIQEWLALDYWTTGPGWFIAALLGFDLLAVLLHKFFPNWIEALGRLSQKLADRPVRYFFGLLGVAIVAYISMRMAFGLTRWFAAGPFAIQANRILLYPTFFIAGIGIGAWGIERGMLAQDGQLVRHWKVWLGAAIVGLAIFTITGAKIIALGSEAPLALINTSSAFRMLTCCALSFLLIAVFVRFFNRHIPLFDSLSANAYGMYLVHYVFVTWIQFELLDVNLPAIQKGLLVFVLTLLFSWATVAALRIIPLAGRILSRGVLPDSAGRV